MLTFFVEITYYRMGSDIYQQGGLAMGLPLSPVLANIYMEYFKEMTLGPTPQKSSMWSDKYPWLNSTTTVLLGEELWH